jgi:lysophospholipase L1-like esterase
MLEWLDQRQTQPTDAEIQAELDRLIAEQPLRNAQQQRAAAYVSEADPLFFKAQRGEATMDDWNAKVAEIRARFPYPTEAN